MLDKDLIPQSHLWTMGLLIGRRAIEATFFPPVDDDDILYHHIPLDPGVPTPLKTVEDAIYENPLLLNPYKAVFIVIDTDRFVILPDDLQPCDSSMAAEAISLATGSDNSPENTLLSVPATQSATLYFEAGSALISFLRRTFYNVDITQQLAPLCSWFTTIDNPEGLLTANIRDNRLDIVATNGTSLLLANTFTFDALADAAYYILAVRTSLPLPSSAAISISGEPAVRDELRSIISSAAPALPSPVAMPLPSQLWRAGNAVAAAPLPLILKSLQ